MAWLSSVRSLVGSSDGGSWSPYDVCETWADVLLLWQMVEAVKAAGPRGSFERAKVLFNVCTGHMAWLSSVRSLVGSSDGGSYSSWDVCETWAEVLELHMIVARIIAAGDSVTDTMILRQVAI